MRGLPITSSGPSRERRADFEEYLLCDRFRAVLDQDLQQQQRFPGNLQRLIVSRRSVSRMKSANRMRILFQNSSCHLPAAELDCGRRWSEKNRSGLAGAL